MRQQLLGTQKVLVHVLCLVETERISSGIFSTGDHLLWNKNGASKHKIQNDCDCSSVLGRLEF